MATLIIKIKDKNFEVFETNASFERQCKWCSKKIKSKTDHYFYLDGGNLTYFCNMPHVKQFIKTKYGL